MPATYVTLHSGLCFALLSHGQSISDSVDRMISNLKTVQYFIIKLILQLYNILGLMSVKFEIDAELMSASLLTTGDRDCPL